MRCNRAEFIFGIAQGVRRFAVHHQLGYGMDATKCCGRCGHPFPILLGWLQYGMRFSRADASCLFWDPGLGVLSQRKRL